MKICVVEDEEVWRNKIQEIIEKYCIDKNILFQIHLCSNGKDFMKKKCPICKGNVFVKRD